MNLTRRTFFKVTAIGAATVAGAGKAEASAGLPAAEGDLAFFEKRGFHPTGETAWDMARSLKDYGSPQISRRPAADASSGRRSRLSSAQRDHPARRLASRWIVMGSSGSDSKYLYSKSFLVSCLCFANHVLRCDSWATSFRSR